MPYIKQEIRDKIDHKIDKLIQKCLKDATIMDKRDGVANYIITRVVLALLRPEDGWNYSSIADVIKTFECAKLEVYERMAVIYESTAQNANGDVKEYKDFDVDRTEGLEG